jgi:hypothetical protein
VTSLASSPTNLLLIGANLNAHRGGFHDAVLSDLPPGHTIRQADGSEGLGRVDRQIDDGKLGTQRAIQAVVLAARPSLTMASAFFAVDDEDDTNDDIETSEAA